MRERVLVEMRVALLSGQQPNICEQLDPILGQKGNELLDAAR